jgi:hypothetical protein
VALITLFLTYAMRSRALIPGRLQSMAELSYEFVANMIRENVGSEGRRYFPFIFTLFMFILFGNVLGMFPFTFTFTSHIIVTFALAAVVFIGRDGDRFRATRGDLPQALRSFRCAALLAAAAGDHRSPFLPGRARSASRCGSSPI